MVEQWSPSDTGGKRKMSVEAIPGGKRRIDRVLDPRFVADVDRLELDELRRRRGEAEAEEEGISYLRRMLQGRIDILRAELLRRTNGAEGEHDVAGLVAGDPQRRRLEQLHRHPQNPHALAERQTSSQAGASGFRRDDRAAARARRRRADQGGRAPEP